MSNKLYIIAGPNGAGKTTASFAILPEILDCDEFVNADEIARGLSPFNPESVNIRAGKLFIHRINSLLEKEATFAFETTLATMGFIHFIKRAQSRGYHVSLLFFWLNSEEIAIKRVRSRVKEGGHDIPIDVIRRRYRKGIKNLVNLYMNEVENWTIIDNSRSTSVIIASGRDDELIIRNQESYNEIIKYV